MRVNIIGTGISGVTGGYHRDGYHWDLGQLILEGLGPGEQAAPRPSSRSY
ncbi:MAG TPA: hypothetical protein VMW69_05350 [Spirochaetia bacterium]|nr:hypothetical protein [Spirochaetia bacterium]